MQLGNSKHHCVAQWNVQLCKGSVTENLLMCYWRWFIEQTVASVDVQYCTLNKWWMLLTSGSLRYTKGFVPFSLSSWLGDMLASWWMHSLFFILGPVGDLWIEEDVDLNNCMYFFFSFLSSIVGVNDWAGVLTKKLQIISVSFMRRYSWFHIVCYLYFVIMVKQSITDENRCLVLKTCSTF